MVRGLPWNLDEFDQAKQAYTSFEMVERCEWWFQHTPRGDSATKPPLVGWMSAGFYRASGSWDVAWRLPSLLASLAILGLLWKSGMEIGGLATAFLATAAFAWNILTLRIATLVRTDMVLTAFIFAAGWLIWRRLQRGEKWTWSDTGWLTFFFTCATMTKGPIYHAFLLPGLGAWLWLAGNLPERKKIGMGYLVASLISLLPFLLWTWLRMQQDSAFYNQVVVKEFLGRFTTGPNAVHNNQTWYFYLPHLLTKTLPWGLLLILALAQREARELLRKHSATLWLVCWLVGGILAMSLVPAKRVDRIFPIIPVAALTLASLLPILREGKWLSPRVLTAIGVLTIAGYTSYTAILVRNGYHDGLGRLVEFGKSARRFCEDKGWNYALIEGRDEGLLLYMGQPEFVSVKTAATELKKDGVTAVVVDSKNLPRLTERAGPLEVLLKADHPTDANYSYFLVKLGGR